MAAVAIKESSVGGDADDCFDHRGVAEVPIELATIERCGRAAEAHECLATKGLVHERPS